MAAGPSRPLNISGNHDLLSTINQNHRETQSRINQLAAKIPTIIQSTQKVSFGSVGANSSVERTINIQNVTSKGVPSVSPTASLGATGFIWSAYIPKANQVVIRILNPTGGAVTPNTVTWNIAVALQ